MAIKKEKIWVYVLEKYGLINIAPAYIYERNGKMRIKPIDKSSKYVAGTCFDTFDNIPKTPKTPFSLENKNDFLKIQYVWLEERDDEWVKNQIAIALDPIIRSMYSNITEVLIELRKLKRKVYDLDSAVMSLGYIDLNENRERRDSIFIFD